jgi:hypothetical protein
MHCSVVVIYIVILGGFATSLHQIIDFFVVVNNVFVQKKLQRFSRSFFAGSDKRGRPMRHNRGAKEKMIPNEYIHQAYHLGGWLVLVPVRKYHTGGTSTV